MTQSLKSYLKALLAVCISVALAFVVGSFMGTPVNPTESRQFQAKVDTAIQTGMVFQDGEAEAYLTVPSHPAPPFWVAVLDWHAWLLAPALILAFLAFRPAAISSLVVSCAAAVFLYYFVAPRPSFVLLVSAAIGMLCVYVLGKARSDATRGAV